MKACRICGRLYPDEGGFCPIDGQELYSATQVAIPSNDQDPRIGQVLSQRYQVRRVVADGGMGRVYEALDMVERRNVALKVLHPEVARDAIAVERFKREFDVSAQLPKRHIVDVIDFQPTPDGSYVLVMEFLYGEELRATLKREGVISPARVVRMLSQIAMALDEAHTKKLVHRDLKPDNIFLCQTSDGDIAKILDFGSVKDKGDGAKKLTVLGTTIGSPFYMAPEQAQGLDSLDHRADVWALAAIAYECVTSHVPFKGVNGPSILLEILTKEPKAASELAANAKFRVPPTLDKAFARAFKKAPGLRTPSVGALADDIGKAYGLSGEHSGWAGTRERTLQEEIDARLPELMTAMALEGVAPRDAAAQFFGAGNSLGPMDAAFDQANLGTAATLAPESTRTAVAAPSSPPMGPASSPTSAAPPSSYVVPTNTPPKWLIPAVVMLALGMLGVILLLFVFTGCSKEIDSQRQMAAEPPALATQAGAVQLASAATPSPAAPAEENANAPSAGSEDCAKIAAPSTIDEENFKITFKAKDPYGAGKPGEAVLELEPKSGYHTNDQYPYKLKLTPCSGLRYPNLTIRDEAIKLEKMKGSVAVPFIPESAGSKILAGTFAFSVCSEERCLVEKRDLSLKIEVQ
jgi:serine/threonine-protein kinase